MASNVGVSELRQGYHVQFIGVTNMCMYLTQSSRVISSLS